MPLNLKALRPLPPQTYKGSTISQKKVKKASSDHYLRTTLKVNTMPIGDSRSRPTEAASRKSDASEQQVDDDEVLAADSNTDEKS